MSEEVDRALADALETSGRRFSTQEEFFTEYCNVLANTIKPILIDYTNSSRVKIQLLLVSVSGDARAFALILDKGREGEHRLEFSPDFKQNGVTASTVSPYGRTSRFIPLHQINTAYVARLGAEFLTPFFTQ